MNKSNASIFYGTAVRNFAYSDRTQGLILNELLQRGELETPYFGSAFSEKYYHNAIAAVVF